MAININNVICLDCSTTENEMIDDARVQSFYIKPVFLKQILSQYSILRLVS